MDAADKHSQLLYDQEFKRRYWAVPSNLYHRQYNNAWDRRLAAVLMLLSYGVAYEAFPWKEGMEHSDKLQWILLVFVIGMVSVSVTVFFLFVGWNIGNILVRYMNGED